MKSRRGNIRTDLAVEAREIIQTTNDNELDDIDGIDMNIYTNKDIDMKVTWVKIYNENGVESMGKPMGNYITIESDLLKENEPSSHDIIIHEFSKRLGQLHKLSESSNILIIGLGNWNITPDALGPKVVSKVLVTRHIKDTLPQDIQKGVRSTCAVSPGVMGITGIETAEIVRGIVSRVKPDLVIAVDALASRKTSRINSTIQLSDTGISPGAGLGNHRLRLNEETLGVPVIAIGVPTVVDAATLVNDTMDMILGQMRKEFTKGSEFYDMLINLESEEKYSIIRTLLDPYSGNMFVTPKEVDEVIERLSTIIANSINIALHPSITIDDVNRY